MAYGQPSVNQIADLYQGNPQALAKRMESEPKGPGGLPRDLSKLMALNIDLTEQDAAKRQAAMSALQQMQQQSPTGEPPTVAESIQQMAAEKARMLAAQQQQQQGLAGAVMNGMQPPQQQGSGIDTLPTNMGENYAGGGIVAFDEGGPAEDEDKLSKEDAEAALIRMLARTGQLPPEPVKERPPYSGPRQKTLQDQGAEWVARRQAERDARAAQESPENIARREALISQIPTGGQTAPASNRRGEDSELERNISNTLAALPGASVTRAATGLRALAPALAAMFSRDKKEQSPEVDNRALLNAAEQRMRESAPTDNRAALNAVDAETRGLPAALPAPARAPSAAVPQRQRPAPAPAAAPATAPVDPMTEQLNSFFKAAIEKTPAQQREEAIARMAQAYGAPDTSAQEKYIKQLEARRAQFEEPTDTYERARAHLRRLANAGGRTWQETGGRASAAAEAERLSNATKSMEVLKELMGETGKVADIKRGYQKELFGFGEKTYDDAFKTGMDVAKELKLDSRQAQLFAHQSAENALQRANAVKVAGMKGAEERMFDDIARDWLSKPENKGKTRADAYAAFNIMKSPAAGARLGGAMTRDQAEDNVRKDLENMMTGPKMISDASAALKAQGIQNPTSLQIKDYLVQQQMTKPAGGAPMASSGKVPALPSGFKLD